MVVRKITTICLLEVDYQLLFEILPEEPKEIKASDHEL